MFNRNQLLIAFKNFADSEASPTELGRCQRLDFHAKRLGFNSYHHFRKTLEAPPARMLGEISIRLLEHVCATREPSRDDCAYYELIPMGRQMGFYSYWIGWDAQGEEVRVPRPLNGKVSVPGLRKQVSHPIYVVESEHELLAWRAGWNATAYVPEDLAKSHFASLFDRKHLVCSDPPLDLVRQKGLARHQELPANISR